MANAPILSIAAISGSQRSRCSWSPPEWIEYIARPLWTPKKVDTEASVRVISRASMPLRRLLTAGRCSP